MPAAPFDVSKLSEVEKDLLAEQLAANWERLWAPTDNEVIRCLVDHGMPRKHAQVQVTGAGHQMAVFARQFYVDAADAKLGDPEAKERVERCREMWGKMNRWAGEG